MAAKKKENHNHTDVVTKTTLCTMTLPRCCRSLTLLSVVWALLTRPFAAGAVPLYTEEDTNIRLLRSKSDYDSVVLESPGIWMVHFYEEGSEECEVVIPTVKALGTLMNGIFQVAVVDLKGSESSAIAEQFPGSVKAPSFFVVPGDDKEKPKKFRKETNLQELANALMEEVTKTLQNRSQKLGGAGTGPGGSSGSGYKPSAGESHVMEINGANFDARVLQNPAVVGVTFAAPWCGHCQRLKPEWEEAAATLRGEGVALGWVDATVEQELASVFGVRGYPTIKIFPGGAPKTPNDAVDYQGERTAAAIVRGMLAEVDRSGVPKEIPELTSATVLEENCAGQNHICVLAVLPHILDSGAAGRNKYRDLLAAVAKSFRGSNFSFLWFEATAQPNLEQTLELTFGAPALVAYSQDRQAYAVMHGSFSEKAITSFLHGITTGRQPTVKLTQLPTVQTVEPWDGQDGAPVEDEIPLSEIMGDEF
jgi:protein disulfide-isomerase A6